MNDLILYPTEFSIAQAKAQMERDRKAMGVTEAFVVEPSYVATQLIEDTRGVTTRKGAAFVIGCPQKLCNYASSARSEGRAVRELANHLVVAHCWEREE